MKITSMIIAPVCTRNRPIRQENFPLLFQTKKRNFYEKCDSFRYPLQSFSQKQQRKENTPLCFMPRRIDFPETAQPNNYHTAFSNHHFQKGAPYPAANFSLKSPEKQIPSRMYRHHKKQKKAPGEILALWLLR